MHITDDFEQSNDRLVESCEDLICMGSADPDAYTAFVRIHLNPWLHEMQRVAETLAGSERLARAAARSGTGSVLEQLRLSGEQRLAQAIRWRDARLAASAAACLCGVALAIEAAAGGVQFGDP